MTNSGPTLWLLMKSPAEQAELQRVLGAESAWCGQILAGAEALAHTTARSLRPQRPDVVVLDRPSYETQGETLRTAWEEAAPAIVLLLEEGDLPQAADLERTGIADFLYRSQISGTRLWVTIRNLWQQQQLQQRLQGQLAVGEMGSGMRLTGQPPSLDGVIDPDGDYKSAEANAIDGHRARFKAIYEQAAVGICLASPSSESVVAANQWFCDFLGYTEAELRCMQYADYSHPEDTLADKALMVKLMAGEIPSFTMEKRLFHKSGALRWVILTVSAVETSPGSQAYSVAVIQDITEQKRLQAEQRQAEITLRENRSFLQTILDNLPISLFVKDVRPEHFGQFVLVNQTCETYFDRGQEEIIGKTDRDLFPTEDANWFVQKDREIIASQARHQLEEIVDRPHMGRRILQTTKVPIYDSEQRPRYLLGISQDITEAREAELALRASERKHRALINALPDLIVRMSGDGVYLDFFAASNMVVLDGEDLIGTNIYDRGLTHDLADLRMGYIRQALASQQLQFYEQELFNGEATVVEEVRIIPSGDDEVLIVVRDISEQRRGEADRKQAETQLSSLAQRLELATTSAQIGIWDFDVTNDRLIWDDRMYELYGQTRSESENRYENWTQALHPDDEPALQAAIQAALSGEQDYHPTFRIVLPDGQIRFIEAHAIVTRDAEGTPEHMIGVNLDISERKRAEVALQQAYESLNQRATELRLTNETLQDTLEELQVAEEELQQQNEEIELARHQAEGERQRYRDLFDFAPNGYLVTDIAGMIQEANQAIAALLKAEPRGLVGRPLSLYVAEHDCPVFRSWLARVCELPQGHKLQIEDLRLRTRSNQLIPVSITGTAIQNEQGQPVKIRLLIQDISERKRGEADRKAFELALQASEERHRELAARLSSIYANAPSYIYEIDCDGTILFVNRTYADIVEEQVIGTSLVDWFPEQQRPGVKALIAQGFDTLTTQSLECDVPDIQGNVLSYAMQIAPMPMQGEEQRAVLIGTDITDRKQAENALQQAAERLKETQRIAKLGGWELDLQTGKSYLSPEALAIHGLPLEGDRPSSLDNPDYYLNFYAPEARPVIRAALQAAMETGEAYDLELPFVTLQGQQIWVRTSAKPVMENGFVTRISGIFMDITERKSAEIALQQLNEELECRVQQRTEELQAERLRLQLALEASNMGTWSYELSTGRLIWSDRLQQIFGFEPCTFLGDRDTFAGMLYPEDRDRVEQLLANTPRTGVPSTTDFRIRRLDGETRWVAISWLISEGATLAGSHRIGVMSDITERKQAEIDLQDSEERFRAAFEQAAVGIVRADLDGNLVQVNQKFCDILGYASPLSLEFKHFSEVTYPEDLAADQASLNRLLAGEGSTFVIEKRYIRRDSTIVWANLAVSLVRSIEGEPVYWIAVIQDISDRKQAEIDLQESRNMLKLVLDAIPQRVFWKDRESRFLGCNPAFANDYQLTHGDIVGKTDAELPWADCAELYNEDDQRVITSGIPRLNYEEPTVNLHGEPIWIRTSKVPLTNVQGEVIGVLGCYDNITDRKRAEQQLQSERLRLQIALDAAQMGAWESTIETEIWSDRTQAIFGYEPGTFPGDRESFISLVYPDDRDRIFGTLPNSFVTQASYHQEYRINRLDGELRWISVHGMVVATEDGTGQRMVGVAQDITDRKRSEDALRVSEERLRLALMAANQGLYDLNVQTGDAIVSPTYATMLGYSPINFQETNAKWLQRLHPDDHERVGAVYKAYMAGEMPTYRVEFRQRMKNGAWKWILSMGKIVEWDQAGQPLRMLGTHTDIDERKRAEGALKVSETRFRQIAENIKEVFWLTSANHEVLYLSPVYEQVWGRSPEAETTETYLDTIYPDDRDRVETFLDQLTLATHQQRPGHTPEIEYRIIRPDGTVRWVRDRAFQVLDNQGQVQRIAGVAEDITDRKLLEQDQARLLGILEASSDYIGIANPDGTILWLNRQFKLLQGLPLDGDISQLSLCSYHPQWALDIIHQEGMPTAMQDGIWVGETALLHRDGTEIPVSQLILAHRSATGEIEYLSTIMRNISTLKEVEQALKRVNADLETRVDERTAELVEAKDAAEAANRAKSVFLANMSHELRTPLNAILGFSQLMGRDATLPSKHLEELQIIGRSGEHLLTLINDILEMSKIEAGQVVLDPDNFSLPQLLNSLMEMLRLRAESKGLTFELHSYAGLPQYIRTDNQKLRQILLNLLSNAIKFTQNGYVILRVKPGQISPQNTESSIDVDVATETGQGEAMLSLRFEVEDSGLGIAADDLNLIFEPFVQTTTSRQAQEGTGLGLPISRQFVQMLGGNLEVKSQPKAGSTFGFEIPVQVIEAEAIAPTEPAQRVLAIAPDQPEYRILIVEDTWANRVLLYNLLTDLGFSVQTAANGQEAVEQWRTWQPQLIFMDIRMPVMNGYEATQAIRQQESSHPPAQPTKIISLTAGVFLENQAEFDQTGFDGFMSKPIQETEITRTIAEHLGVHYLYDTESTMADTSAAPSGIYLTVKVLQALSLDWLTQFQRALTHLDQEQMLALIAELPPEQAPLAQALDRKVQDFDYELLLDLIQANLEGKT